MRRKRILTDLLALTLAFIWGNSLLSREVSGAISDSVMELMNRRAEMLGLGSDYFTYMADIDGDGTPEPTSRTVRKAAHVIEFAVLGALLWLRLEGKRRSRLKTVLQGVLAAAADETIQLFSHRGSRAADVLIDSAGVLLGLGIVWAAAALRRRGAGENWTPRDPRTVILPVSRGFYTPPGEVDRV